MQSVRHFDDGLLFREEETRAKWLVCSCFTQLIRYDAIVVGAALQHL